MTGLLEYALDDASIMCVWHKLPLLANCSWCSVKHKNIWWWFHGLELSKVRRANLTTLKWHFVGAYWPVLIKNFSHLCNLLNLILRERSVEAEIGQALKSRHELWGSFSSSMVSVWDLKSQQIETWTFLIKFDAVFNVIPADENLAKRKTAKPPWSTSCFMAVEIVSCRNRPPGYRKVVMYWQPIKT